MASRQEHNLNNNTIGDEDMKVFSGAVSIKPFRHPKILRLYSNLIYDAGFNAFEQVLTYRRQVRPYTVATNVYRMTYNPGDHMRVKKALDTPVKIKRERTLSIGKIWYSNHHQMKKYFQIRIIKLPPDAFKRMRDDQKSQSSSSGVPLKTAQM